MWSARRQASRTPRPRARLARAPANFAAALLLEMSTIARTVRARTTATPRTTVAAVRTDIENYENRRFKSSKAVQAVGSGGKKLFL